MTVEDFTLEKLPESLEPRPVLEDISVVIPTLGRSILETALSYLLQACAWPAELIVVDQGSNRDVDLWLERAASWGVRVMHVRSSERGRAAGVNRGFERLRTPYVAVTDDDCFVDAQWLESMRARLHQYPEAIVTGRVEAAGEAVLVVATSSSVRVSRHPRLRFDHLSGGNMGTSKRVLEQVGLLDEDPRVRTAEDGEWAYRALRRGISLVYAPEITVRHFGWRGAADRVVQYRDYARSQGGFYGKYLRRGDCFIALRAVVHHGRALRRWVRGTLRGDRELALYGRAYFTGLLPGILAGLHAPRRQQGSV